MSPTYTATYYNASGYFYQATIFLSSVTISIKYRDEENKENDVYWLGQDVTAFQEQDMSSELQYLNKQGKTERLVIRDPQLLQALKGILSQHRVVGKPHKRLLGNVFAKLTVIAGVIAGVLLMAYLWLMP